MRKRLLVAVAGAATFNTIANTVEAVVRNGSTIFAGSAALGSSSCSGSWRV